MIYLFFLPSLCFAVTIDNCLISFTSRADELYLFASNLCSPTPTTVGTIRNFVSTGNPSSGVDTTVRSTSRRQDLVYRWSMVKSKRGGKQNRKKKGKERKRGFVRNFIKILGYL